MILDKQTKAYVVYPEYLSTIDFLELGTNFLNMFTYVCMCIMYICCCNNLEIFR